MRCAGISTRLACPQIARHEEAAQMTQIDYFLTTLSPYVYLAGTRPTEIAARHGARLRYRPVHFASLAPRMGGRLRSQPFEWVRCWKNKKPPGGNS